MAGPTSNPFMKAFACAGVVFVAVIIAALVVLEPPVVNTVNASELVGRLFATVAMAALATGFFAHRSANTWSIGRIIATYVLAFIIVVALQLNGIVQDAAQTKAQNASTKARNASQGMMLSVDDYLRLLPETDIMGRVREATKAKDAHNRFSEIWPTKTGNDHLHLDHISKGAVVTSTLIVATDEVEAKRALEESFRGAIAGMKEKVDISVSAVSGLETWNPNGRFYFITRGSGAPFANLFLLIRRNNVVVISLRGPHIYNDPDSIKTFLNPKIDGLLSFKPAF